MVDLQICKSIGVEQHMIAFRELLESGLLAEYSRDVELGEVLNHVRQCNNHLFGVLG